MGMLTQCYSSCSVMDPFTVSGGLGFRCPPSGSERVIVEDG